MNLKELETEILKLNPQARAKLAAKLLESLDTLSEAEHERLWADEAPPLSVFKPVVPRPPNRQTHASSS